MSARRRRNDNAAKLGQIIAASGMTTLDEDRLSAAAALIPRLGCTDMTLRYDEGDKEGDVVVWNAIAYFPGAQPQVAGALTPYRAVYRLLEQLMDGGICNYCKKPTGIVENFDEQPPMLLVCWYSYDPELKVFRRGCEGRGK